MKVDIDDVKYLLPVLLQSKDYAIVMINAQEEITYWSDGGEALYGYSHAETLGQPFSILYTTAETEAGKPAEHLRYAVESGRFEWEEWRLRKDGSVFYGNMVLTPVNTGDGRGLKGYAIIVRDATAKQLLAKENFDLQGRLEGLVRVRTQQLANVNKELEAFSYSVSHDLRAPLRAISGYSMILQEDYSSKLDAEGARLLDAILQNTKMMGQLIDDLLSFSRMGRLETNNDTVDMDALVKSCLTDIKYSEPKQRPEVHVEQLPACWGDGQMLKQVWMNIIGNAFKYSSRNPNARIDIGCVAEEGRFVYFVRDNGVGFDIKYVDKLFGVFQRLHSMAEFEGTGLGLALAKRIINKHGGDIRAEAVLDEGACFYFSIPKQST